MALEDLYYNLASAGSQPCVIICDRGKLFQQFTNSPGTMDTAAYMTNENFDVLLDDYNWNVVDLRDKRYDAVIHLVTAAIGAEKFYTTENNAARSEDLSQARDLDFKVLNAWVGHPHIRIVDNSTGFSQKINRVEEVICQVVGAPRPTRGERKFILSGDSTISSEVAGSAGIKIESFIVEQTYLSTKSDSQFEVRKGISRILHSRDTIMSAVAALTALTLILTLWFDILTIPLQIAVLGKERESFWSARSLEENTWHCSSKLIQTGMSAVSQS